MQVSAFPAIFKADFGRFWRVSAVFRPYRPPADTARFWLNQPGLARIEADSARIELHRRESSRVGANPRKKKKKKKRIRGPTRGQPRRTSRPASDAASRVGRGCGTSGAVSVLSRSLVCSLSKTFFLNLLLFLSLSCFPASTPSGCCVNWFKKTKER